MTYAEHSDRNSRNLRRREKLADELELLEADYVYACRELRDANTASKTEAARNKVSGMASHIGVLNSDIAKLSVEIAYFFDVVQPNYPSGAIACKNCKFYNQVESGFGDYGCGNPKVVGSSHVNTWISPKNPVPDESPRVFAVGEEWEGVGFSPDFGCIFFEIKDQE